MSHYYPFKYALKELRKDLSKFYIFWICLFLGTAIIAAIASVTDNIADNMKGEGQRILGGDIEIGVVQKSLTQEELQYLSKFGQVSKITSLTSMARSDDDASMVTLKVIDHQYPLYGSITYKNADVMSYGKIENLWGAAISESIGLRLGRGVGDEIKIGDTAFQVRSIIEKKPDEAVGFSSLMPSILISQDALKEASLLKTGSMYRNYYRLKFHENQDIESFKQALKKQFPDAVWRVRDAENTGSRTESSIKRMGQFLTLVGLSSLLIGGVGIGNAIGTYLSKKRENIAVLKILGAQGSVIFKIYLFQILMVGLSAILAGLLMGAFLPIVFADILKETLAFELSQKFFYGSLFISGVFSFLVMMIFTIIPLARAQNIKAKAIFRDLVSSDKGTRISYFFLALVTVLIIAFITMMFLFWASYKITAGFIIGIFTAFLIFTFMGYVVKKITKYFSHIKNTHLRMAFSNIYRADNRTTSVILSLGLGLIMIVMVSLVQTSMVSDMRGRVTGKAPSFFYMDIQKSQMEDLKETLKKYSTMSEFKIVPNLRGRVTEIKGINVSDAKISPDARWIVRGDRGLTFSSKVPEGNEITKGAWWDKAYSGTPEISITDQMERGMDLKIGDEITISILGRSFKTKVASVRKLDWRSFRINFALMMDPHTLKSAPFTYLASVKISGQEEAAAYKTIAQKFPNISIIRTKELLAQLGEVLGKVTSAINGIAFLSIIMGVLVLAGALTAGQQMRSYDSAILKLLGAQRKDILKAYLYEFIILGFVSGIIALVLGSAGAYVIVTELFKMSWQLEIFTPIMVVLISIFMIIIVGASGIYKAMTLKPLQIMRR